jgi:hypothetical protein
MTPNTPRNPRRKLPTAPETKPDAQTQLRAVFDTAKEIGDLYYPRKPQEIRIEYKEFAEKVHAAMLKKRMNISDLARAIWGSVTDYRGFTVAKNRDRAGFYLAGESYPNEENLRKLAKALDLNVDELRVEKPSIGVQRTRTSDRDVQLTILASDPSKALLQISLLMPTDGAVQVVALINEILNKTSGGRSMRADTVVSMMPPTVAA